MMKKIILFVLFGIVCSSVSFAEEMVVQLKSGNTLTIDYSGTIHVVTLAGETDAIAGITMPAGVGQGITPDQEKRNAAVKKDVTKEKKLHLKWSQPKSED